MGSEFTAIFGHTFKKIDDIIAFKNELDDSTSLKKSLISLTGKKIDHMDDIQWYWGYTNRHQESQEELVPGYFVTLMFDNRFKLIIGKSLCEFSCLIGWTAFLDDENLQKKLREICFWFSKHLGNLVYLPDRYSYSDYVYDGYSITDVLQSLEKNFGHPKLNITSLYEEQGISLESKGYYIDLFEDLHEG